MTHLFPLGTPFHLLIGTPDRVNIHSKAKVKTGEQLKLAGYSFIITGVIQEPEPSKFVDGATYYELKVSRLNV